MSARELVFYIDPAGPERRSIMKLLAEHGCRRIGTDGCGWDPETDAREFDAFRDDIAQSGLGVYSTHAIQPLLATPGREPPGDLWDAVLKDLRRLVRFGGRTAVYHTCALRDVPPDETDEAIARVGREAFVGNYAAAVRRLAREAAPHGITVVLENLGHTAYARSVEGILEIVNAADEPNVAICLDSGHAHLEGLDVAREVRAAGALLKDTHFHDNPGPSAELDQHIPPGLGTIDWQEVCRALDEIGYPGPMVFEGVLGPRDSVSEGRFGGRLSHEDLIGITISNWRAFEALADQG